MKAGENGVEVTVVMPCLNEAGTVGACIDKANTTFERLGIEGEVVVADNGSTDGSAAIAAEHGARVVRVEEKGYGVALLAGIEAACGTYVVMGDADESYDFSELGPFVEKLREGYDLVMGNRFLGGIRPGAMPPLHRYVGNPVLSLVGRVFFRAPIRDFHCGLRGFTKTAALDMDLQTTGMEFASEMVVKACLLGMKICEIPASLSPDGRDRPPHLRSWRDGWRHLRFLLIFSPYWLFLYPGCLLAIVGLLAGTLIWLDLLHIGAVVFGIHTLVYATGAVIVGFNSMLFAVLARTYGYRMGLIPGESALLGAFKPLSLEAGIAAGALLCGLGVLGAVAAVLHWGRADFGGIDPRTAMRIVAPSMLAIVLGTETILFSFFLSMLNFPTRSRHR